MYCINCGVKLSDTEEKCPLCETVPGAPYERGAPARPLYPKNKLPEATLKRGALNGALIILFMIPILVSFFVDLQANGNIEWFWYVAGALVLLYVIFILPLWFSKPNPVVFVPCGFVAAALYLLLINILTDGKWFLSFALPVTVCVCLITTAMVVLLKYVRKGKLYIVGGAMIAMGAVMLLMEELMTFAFDLSFTGWSVYPLIALGLLGGLLIFLAINGSAREKMERRFFF
ncbi:MAG: hypothetical protein IJ017_01045 [Oscillospiraceae bacterium]|nr:hypothetical protein [Oscillospiraceae bacterium]